jgi:hypothetical protein
MNIVYLVKKSYTHKLYSLLYSTFVVLVMSMVMFFEVVPVFASDIPSSATASLPTAQLIFPSGVTATVSTSGSGSTTLNPVTTTGPISLRNALPADYTPNLATTTPGILLRTIVGAPYCVNTSMATLNCINASGGISDLGTVTITFSRPVTNPTIHFAGIGGTRR